MVNKLFEQKFKNNIRTISGTGGVIYPDDVVLLCDTSLGAVTINLLDIPTDKWSTQYKLYIVDKSGNASTNNITINAPLGVLINGFASFVIVQNSGSLVVRVGSNNTYVGQYSGGGGGGSVNGHIIQDEGVSLPQRIKLNFVGAGVTATDDALNNATVVTIGGGGGGALIYLTNAQLIALVTAGTIVAGQFYCVTDCTNAPQGVVVQGV